jgi:hypothetical protein
MTMPGWPGSGVVFWGPLTLPAQIAYQCRLILLDGQERGVRQDRTRQNHSGGAGIIEANEQVTFASLPRDRHPATGHPLPDLPPHRALPAGKPQ